MVGNTGIYITWLQLLYVGILVLSFYLVELIFFWWKHGRQPRNQDQAEQLQQQISELLDEVAAIKVRFAGLSMQFQNLDFIDEPVQRTPLSTVIPEVSPPAESPYAHAIRLAQKGADAPEVAVQCGISRGEADLIVAIYRSAERG